MTATKPKPRISKRALFRDLGYEPHPGQWRIHRSQAPRRVVACGVRWGKTTAAAMEGLAAALQPKKRNVGWIVAPTYDLCDRVFREIVVTAFEHLRRHVEAVKESERRLLLTNISGATSEIRGKSADNPVSLLGEGLDWLIVDEAARLRPHIWESHLSQRLIDKRGWALLISTPKGKGWLYNLFQRGQKADDAEYESWNTPTWENPLLSREMIERERLRLPERVFRQEYGAEFIEGAGAVFRHVRECATSEKQGPVDGETYYAGLDLAKVEDFTVLVIANSAREVVYWDRFNRLDWAIQVQRVKAAVEKYNRAKIWVDSTGKGEPIYEALASAGCDVEPYSFTQRSKAALVDNLSLLFEQQMLRIPEYRKWPEAIEELEAFEYAITDSGNTKTGAPSGGHDDCVIALALALWPLGVQTGDVIGEESLFL